MKKFFIAILALMMFTACSGGGGESTPKADPNTVRIGYNLELTGDVASYGNSELEGVELAIKLANEKGGVLGKQIVGVKYDNQSDQTEAVSVQTKLATLESVVGIVSPLSVCLVSSLD